MNAINKIAEKYRRIPKDWAYALATIASLGLATITGLLGAFAGMYLYDRGMSKGNDLVGMGGLFAVGTFTFVVVFTWLQNLHHKISPHTPLFAWLICLTVPATFWHVVKCPESAPIRINHPSASASTKLRPLLVFAQLRVIHS